MYLSVFVVVTLSYCLLPSSQEKIFFAIFLLYCLCVFVCLRWAGGDFLLWLVKEKQGSFYFSGFSAVTFTQRLTWMWKRLQLPDMHQSEEQSLCWCLECIVLKCSSWAHIGARTHPSQTGPWAVLETFTSECKFVNSCPQIVDLGLWCVFIGASL